MKVVITGANGHLGRRLIGALKAEHNVCALVRSQPAAERIWREHKSCQVHVVDYANEEDIARFLVGADYAVHLVGIIKESLANPFNEAHEVPCEVLTRAVAGTSVKGIVHISVLGSDARSTNDCFRSRGKAEDVLLAGSTPARIIRVPMVLGEDDYASHALAKQARRTIAFTFRSRSLEQPIFAGDVVTGIVNSIFTGFTNGVLRLAGPESLTRAALIRRASKVIGRSPPIVVSLPLAIGLSIASFFEGQRNPPVTRAMLGVLDHDDDIDPTAACEALDLTLTTLDDALGKVIAKPAI